MKVIVSLGTMTTTMKASPLLSRQNPIFTSILLNNAVPEESQDCPTLHRIPEAFQAFQYDFPFISELVQSPAPEGQED